MITAVSAAALEHKDLIIKLATQFRLPVVYVAILIIRPLMRKVVAITG